MLLYNENLKYKMNNMLIKWKECPLCEEGKLIDVDDIVSEIEGHFFVERGTRCDKCGEEFIPEKQAQKTIEIARKLGIWRKKF